jgi:hypothetical protein
VRITSEDRETILEIILNDPDDPYSDYTLRAAVKDERNPLSGQNDGVHFSAFDLFLERLSEFIKSRSGVAVLEMTEDCRLEFFRWNARGDAGVSARITKYRFSADSERTVKNTLEVEFKIDGEFVNQIYEDFTKMRGA